MKNRNYPGHYCSSYPFPDMGTSGQKIGAKDKPQGRQHGHGIMESRLAGIFFNDGWKVECCRPFSYPARYSNN
ncbi:MAG: hypothetical protein ACXWB9_03020 [Flavisolibacter sp.]